jgi:DNA-binding CsgD family transcriptional regulator
MKTGSRVKHWTPEEDERLRSMIVEGHSPAEISLQLQRSVSAVYARTHVLRLSFKRLRLRLRSD